MPRLIGMKPIKKPKIDVFMLIAYILRIIRSFSRNHMDC